MVIVFLDTGSEHSETSIAKKKKDGRPDIKVEYKDPNGPIDNWSHDFDNKNYHRYSAKDDELSYPNKALQVGLSNSCFKVFTETILLSIVADPLLLPNRLGNLKKKNLHLDPLYNLTRVSVLLFYFIFQIFNITKYSNIIIGCKKMIKQLL